MASFSPPSDGDRDRAHALLAIYWTPFPFTFALICARFFVRIRIKRVGLDDYTMLLAWVLLTISNALATVSMLHGGARHIYHLKPAEVAFVFKHTFISSRFTSAAAAIGKSSVAFLLLRLIGPNAFRQRWFIYVNVTIYLAIAFVSFIIQLVQCIPTKALWRPVPGSRCWSPNIAANMNILQSAYGTYLDFALALMPITFIKDLNMSFKSKIGLCLLLGLGVIAGVFTGIKTANLHHLSSHEDFTWANYREKMWSEIEIALVIICGCIPTIKPLFDRAFKGKPLKPARSLYPSAYPGKRSYQMHSDTNGPGRSKIIGHTGNSTNVTTRVDSKDTPGDPDYTTPGILVERGIDVEISDWESNRELVGKGITYER